MVPLEQAAEDNADQDSVFTHTTARCRAKAGGFGHHDSGLAGPLKS